MFQPNTESSVAMQQRQGRIPFSNKLTNNLVNLHVCKVRLPLLYMQSSVWQMLIAQFVKLFLTLDIAMTLCISLGLCCAANSGQLPGLI